MIKHISLLFAVILLVSCHQSPDSYSTYDKEESYSVDLVAESMDIEPPRTGEPPAPPSTANAYQSLDDQSKTKPQAVERNKAQKIIKNGSISVDVEDLQKAKSSLDKVMKSIDAYYESETYHNGYNTNEYHLTIRVPNDGFDELTESLDGDFGQITSKEINAKDVTEEYVDLGIRLESKLVALSAYQKFLKRATNVEEILQVQNQIRRIEEEIESKKGRLRYLDDKVAYSTLRINLIQDIPVIAKAEIRYFGTQVKNAFVSGYDGVLSIIIALIYVWPLWIVLGLLAFLLKRKKYFFRKKIA